MSTTSSSPRKPRTTGSSRRAAALAASLLAASCGGADRGTFVTYFNGDHGVSLRHPASWRAEQAEQDGVFYRHFLAPPAGAPGRSPLSVTLLAGPMTASVEEYAQRYLAGHGATSTQPEERQGVEGRSWVFASADGKSRYRLLLLASGGRVIGLYAQGDAEGFEKQAKALDEMWSSLTLERPDRYRVIAFREQRASLGIPDSWRETRRFSGGGTLVASYVSPALAVGEDGQAVHASLAVTFEAVPEGGGLQEYYDGTRRRLGDNFQVTNHSAFKEGYVDVMRTETPVAVSYVKRFYFARSGRGCSLVFEAREDVFPRASRWADYVASTLSFGGAGGAAK
jgi:hypothetical protein